MGQIILNWLAVLFLPLLLGAAMRAALAPIFQSVADHSGREHCCRLPPGLLHVTRPSSEVNCTD